MSFLGGLFGSRYKRPDTTNWQWLVDEMNDPKRRGIGGGAYDPEQPLVGGGMVSAPNARMEKEPGFWQGGEHFGGRDAVAGILAAIGDAFARQSGGEGWATQNLMGGRLSAIEMAKKAQQQQAQIEAARQRYQAAGIDPARADLAAHGDDSGWLPKEQELPERARMAQWYMNASPQERAAFDASNPIITNGYGSTVVPRSSLQSGGPAPGTIEDGHQFIGGDPSDQNNWKPVGGAGLASAPRTFRRR